MMYKVYQDGKLADTSGYPELHVSWSPESNTHVSLDAAILYAHHYAYPAGISAFGSCLRKMELNVPIDMGMSEIPVMMEVRRAEA